MDAGTGCCPLLFLLSTHLLTARCLLLTTVCSFGSPYSPRCLLSMEKEDLIDSLGSAGLLPPNPVPTTITFRECHGIGLQPVPFDSCTFVATIPGTFTLTPDDKSTQILDNKSSK